MKEEKDKTKKKKNKWKVILLTILVIILIVGGYITYKTIKNGGGISGLLATMLGHNENTLKEMDPITVLLLGESENMTDTILIATYNPKNQRAALLSIPRDTFVGKNLDKARAADKINSIYNMSKKDPEKVLAAVNKLTDLDIKYYVVIDTKALIELVDTIGGVEFDVPIDMDYDDSTQDLAIHLKAGFQKLNGQQAEGLVRFRHNNNGTSYSYEYGDNDFGRMRTQREFVTVVLKQTVSAKNILKIKNLLDIAHKNVKTNISLSVAKDYIPYIVDFNTEDIKTDFLPGESKLTNGVWVYVADMKKAKSVIEELLIIPNLAEEENSENDIDQNVNNTISQNTTTDSKNTTNSAGENSAGQSKEKTSTLRIEILNGSEITSNLSNVTTKLKNAGYNVVKTGNTNVAAASQIINRTHKGNTTCSDLKEALGIGTIIKGEDNSNVDFTIIIGKDYK